MRKPAKLRFKTLLRTCKVYLSAPWHWHESWLKSSCTAFSTKSLPFKSRLSTSKVLISIVQVSLWPVSSLGKWLSMAVLKSATCRLIEFSGSFSWAGSIMNLPKATFLSFLNFQCVLYFISSVLWQRQGRVERMSVAQICRSSEALPYLRLWTASSKQPAKGHPSGWSRIHGGQCKDSRACLNSAWRSVLTTSSRAGYFFVSSFALGDILGCFVGAIAFLPSILVF